MLPIRTILHPTDFSSYSDYAFRMACSLARDYGARVIVTHVAETPMPVFGDGVVLPPPQVSREPLLAKLNECQAPDGSVPVEPWLVEGDPATEILRVAEEGKCDLIVMGTHGRTGFGRLLMGSVAEQVVRKAPCPVLTIRTPTAEAAPVQEPVGALAGQR